nr:MAG TPA: hypothetical protein [Caudoviricetes sp.]
MNDVVNIPNSTDNCITCDTTERNRPTFRLPCSVVSDIMGIIVSV